MTALSRRRALIGVLLLAGVVVGLLSAHRKEVSELVVYVGGAERMSEGQEIYRPTDAKPFTYPPAFALPFLPFVFLPEGAHRTVWFFTNLVVFGGILWALRDLLRRFASSIGHEARPTGWIWAVTALLAGRHVSAVFENQSHDMLVFGTVTLAAWAGARGREGLAGAAAGVGAAFKATPLLFAPLFFVQRRVRALSCLVVSVAVMVWLPDLLFPRADGGSWVVAWYRTFLSGIEVGGTAEAEGAWNAWNLLNQNLASSLYRLMTPVPQEQWTKNCWDASVVAVGPAGLKLITLAAQAAIVLHLLWSSRPSLAKGEAAALTAFRRLGEAGLVGCGMVLLSPMSSKAHFCVLTLAALFAVSHYALVRRDRTQLVLLVLAAATGLLSMKGLVGSSFGNVLLANGVVCWHTVLLMLAAGRALRLGMSDRRAASAAAAAA
jgi:hypothetical protein